MTAPRVSLGAVAPYAAFPPAAQKWTARKDRRPVAQPKIVPYTRRYEIMWLDETGFIEDAVRTAPATAAFEAAFSAFTHGTVIATTEGPVAVEDLVPGMMIETAEGAPARLEWIGSMSVMPGGPERGGLDDRLYRVIADAFGLGRPATDATFGPGARFLDRSPETRNRLGTDAALAPIAAYADGDAVIEITPVTPAKVYHLGFDRHHVIRANGIEVESFHPGPESLREVDEDMRAQFMALFPHKSRLQDFGRMLWPRFETAEDALA